MRYPDMVIGPQEAPLPEHCPSCGGEMPVDGEGGYNCETFFCESCQEIICEDCRLCPADFLVDREYLALLKYFSDRGYKTGTHSTIAVYEVTHSYCKGCLRGVELTAVEAIPRGELLHHTNDKWYFEEAQRAYADRLSKGE